MTTKQKTFWFAVGGLLLVAIALRIALSYWLYPMEKPPVVSDPQIPTHPNSSSAIIFGSAIITYTDAGFSPNTININVQTLVTFKNESSKPFQPASDRGLNHQGSCIDNTEAGSCKPIPLGGSWSGTFETVGVWGYHDQLNPSATATIMVSAVIP